MGSISGKVWSVGIASVIVIGSSMTAMAGSASKTYYGGVSEFQEDFVNATAGQSAPPTICQQNPGISEACFKVEGVSTVHIDIADQHAGKVPARIWYYDAAYMRTDSQRGDTICSSGDVVLPDGTVYIDIKIGPIGREASSPTSPPTGLPPMACGAPQTVTTGTVTISGDGIGSRDSRSASAVREPGQAAHRRGGVGSRSFTWNAQSSRLHGRVRLL